MYIYDNEISDSLLDLLFVHPKYVIQKCNGEFCYENISSLLNKSIIQKHVNIILLNHINYMANYTVIQNRSTPQKSKESIHCLANFIHDVVLHLYHSTTSCESSLVSRFYTLDYIRWLMVWVFSWSSCINHTNIWLNSIKKSQFIIYVFLDFWFMIIIPPKYMCTSCDWDNKFDLILVARERIRKYYFQLVITSVQLWCCQHSTWCGRQDY